MRLYEQTCRAPVGGCCVLRRNTTARQADGGRLGTVGQSPHSQTIPDTLVPIGGRGASQEMTTITFFVRRDQMTDEIVRYGRDQVKRRHGGHKANADGPPKRTRNAGLQTRQKSSYSPKKKSVKRRRGACGGRRVMNRLRLGSCTASVCATVRGSLTVPDT